MLNSPEIFPVIWFITFVILIMGYAILDGFDLGVGMLHLFSKQDEERRKMINAIGPIWDGNAVWLVTSGGALFAGFPKAFASICSAFYIPIMMMLSGLIFRAVAIEFRSKQPMAWWRWFWDVMFSVASLIIAFTLGVMAGNMIRGVPLDLEGEYTADFLYLLNPYALLLGCTAVALFLMHGATFILMKTEGELHDKLRKRVNPTIILFVLFYATLTQVTLIFMPHMSEAMVNRPYGLIVSLINVLAIANIPREISKGRDFRAFLSSSVNIVTLLILFGIGVYPNLLRAINDPEHLSITIQSAASSTLTLQILILIAIVGMPLVISYTTVIYWFFRGKVKLDATSY